jgi:hypothetical protein
MDHDYIDEHGLVERYVKRRLEPQLEQAFEIHLLDCPRCIDAIETAEFLEAGLRDGLAADPPAAVPPRRARPLTWLADAFLQRPGLALAALLVIAIGPAALVLRMTPTGEGSPAAMVRGDAAILALAPVRSASIAPPYRLTLGETPFPVVLLLEVEPDSCEQFAVTLSGPDDVTVWHGEDLVLGTYDTIPLIIDSGLLQPGDYRVEVRPGAACAAPSRLIAGYRLRAVP